MKNTIFRNLFLLLFLAVACQEPVPMLEPPIIRFEQEELIFKVKVGKELILHPIVENDQEASYLWKDTEGTVLGTQKELKYTWQESDEIYLTFQVNTEAGSAEEEILVIVTALAPPVIQFALPSEEGFLLSHGEHLLLDPEVTSQGTTQMEWFINGKSVSQSRQLDFSSEKAGCFQLRFEAKNEDGKDQIEFNIEVKAKSDLPFSWQFREEYHIASGRELYIQPMDITHAGPDAIYIWKEEGQIKQKGKESGYVFQAQKEGKVKLTVTMDNPYTRVTHELTIQVCPPEGKYRRPVSESSQAEANQVYEYLPAPGQYINEWEEEIQVKNMEEACHLALQRMKEGKYISLGGFGGYIILGFDHSIGNDEGYNLQIGGNSFAGSSEPGIVYVMQDENGNGRPDDNWYELKGSEYGQPETQQDYVITYYRPRKDHMDVEWTDHSGKKGKIEYNEFHPQSSYYPSWVESDSYVLRGSCLKARTENRDGIWYNDAFGWGYADNFSAIDRLEESVHENANHFKISHAVTFDGKPAHLQYIDFVKIQTGVNAQSGIIGEISTEIMKVKDYNIVK